jgi:hypothetical protein
MSDRLLKKKVAPFTSIKLILYQQVPKIVLLPVL